MPSRNTTLFTFFLLVALLACLAAAPVSADVVHLRTGEAIKGRPLPERSDESVLIIQDYLSGALRSLTWDVVDPLDRERLWVDWNWKDKTQRTIAAHRITLLLQDGSTEDVLGLIEKQDDAAVHLRTSGKVIPVKRDKIKAIIEEEMDPREIWTEDQLYDQFREDLVAKSENPGELNSREHWRLAEYAEWARAYEKARDHYQTCAEDPDFLRAAVARQRLVALESLISNRAALQTLRDIRMGLNVRAFRRVAERLDAFPAENPDVSEAVNAQLDKLKKDFAARRTDHFQTEAKLQFPKIVLQMIEDKVTEKDIGMSDVTAWTRRDLPDAAFTELAAAFKRWDDVDAEAARGFWETRKKGSWKTATYGSGTFIVNPPKIKPPKRKTPSSKSSGGRSSGGRSAAPAIEIPKPPTRDQWWAKADTKTRVSWVMAFFAQNSGFFEVRDEPKWSLCIQCNGLGLQSKRLSNGEELTYLCTRCGGAQRDMRIMYK